MLISVAYFDIGQTLGTPRLTPSLNLEGLDVFPYVPDILNNLKNQGIRLGIISNTGNDPAETVNAALRSSGLLSYFDEGLLIYSSQVGLEKNSPEIFDLAAQTAGQPPENCMFVGEDARERRFADQAGMRVCPHPLLALDVAKGETVHYARLTAPDNADPAAWRSMLHDLGVVPVHVAGRNGEILYAILSGRAVQDIFNAQFTVQILGKAGQPLTSALYLLRDDKAKRTGFMSVEGQAQTFFERGADADWLLASSPDGILVALPGDRSVEEWHFAEAQHGHNLKLTPDPLLLQPFGTGPGAVAADFVSSTAAPAAAAEEPDETVMAALAAIDAAAIQRYLDVYAGINALDDEVGTKITSRHIRSPDNLRSVAALARDLERIGGGDFQVRLHPFTHEGSTLYNVEAELVGSGSDELVLVTAHLDSTAANSPPYDPSDDPAPGADDDASGVAAVLAIAERFKELAAASAPRRRIRFVLFNAEEHGLVGSKAYARAQAARGEPIVAVYQMDMIGYNREAPRSFEVHAGYLPSADVQERSEALARRLRDLASRVSPDLAEAQIYVSTGLGDRRDPAEGRSDHAPFQERGYAACVTSEDFFAGPLRDSPEPEDNPNYHKNTDTFVDTAFAADIARAVAASAWSTANL